MAALSGKAGKVTWPAQVVALMKSWRLELECDEHEVTTFDSGGARGYIPGLLHWRGACELLLDSDVGNKPSAPGVSTAQIELEGKDGDAEVTYYGEAFCRRIEVGADMEQPASLAYEFIGTGDLTIGSAPL